MEPWILVLVAVAVVVLASASVLYLRRRRAGSILVVRPDGKVSRRRA